MGQRSAVVAALVAAFVLLGGPAASACVTDDWVTVQAVGVGPGDQVPVQGGGLEPGTAEIRWNGMSGDLLATAEVGADGRFTATVVVPQVGVAGRYPVVVVQPAEGGQRGWAYTDLVLAEPVPPAQPVPFVPPVDQGPEPYLLLVLLGVPALGLLLWARRRRSAEAARLRAELDRLVEEERAPVNSGSSRD